MNYLVRYKNLLIIIFSTLLTVIFSVVVQYKRADLIDIAINRNGKFELVSIYFVLFILLEIVFTYFMNSYSKKFAISESQYIREEIYNKYNSKKYELGSEEKSNIINIMTQQIDLLKSNYIMQLMLLIFLVSKSLLIVLLMFRINILLTLIVLLMLLTQIILPKICGKTLKKFNDKYIEKVEKFNQNIKQFVDSYKLNFSFSAQKFFFKSFDESLNELSKSEFESFKYNNMLRSFNMFISYTTHLITIILVGYLLFKSFMDIKTAYLLIGFVEQLSYPLIGISFAYQSVISFKSTKEKIINEAKVMLSDETEEKELFKAGEISLNNISFSYDKTNIIQNFNTKFGVKKYLIKGKSGFGKTTLLKMLSKDINNYSGKILIDGNNIKSINTSELIGFMDDTPIFINDTLKNNIALGKEMQNDEIIKLFENLNLSKLVDRLDDSIDTSNYELSLGERKRIELIRVITRNYKIILLDEPTSNIDDLSKKEIIKIIKNLDNCILICTSHDTDKEFLTIFDEIIDLEKENVSR